MCVRLIASVGQKSKGLLPCTQRAPTAKRLLRGAAGNERSRLSGTPCRPFLGCNPSKSAAELLACLQYRPKAFHNVTGSGVTLPPSPHLPRGPGNTKANLRKPSPNTDHANRTPNRSIGPFWASESKHVHHLKVVPVLREATPVTTTSSQKCRLGAHGEVLVTEPCLPARDRCEPVP